MINMNDVEVIIDRLDLSSHPEGGYYSERYRSEQLIRLPEGEERSAGTGIYFLLPEGTLSNWHRVRWDEVWHFYDGDELILETINQDGRLQKLKLGNALAEGTEYQHLVPQNSWQRAYSTGSYSLVGCTVSPGFEFEDFEMAESEKLAEKYPDIKDEIISNPF